MNSLWQESENEVSCSQAEELYNADLRERELAVLLLFWLNRPYYCLFWLYLVNIYYEHAANLI